MAQKWAIAGSMGMSVILKMTVRREIGELAKREARRRRLSVSNYLCRILEDKLLGKGKDSAWSLDDLEEASRKANLGKTSQNVDEMLGEIFSDLSND
jgi:hypothetical protein